MMSGSPDNKDALQDHNYRLQSLSFVYFQTRGDTHYLSKKATRIRQKPCFLANGFLHRRLKNGFEDIVLILERNLDDSRVKWHFVLDDYCG